MQDNMAFHKSLETQWALYNWITIKDDGIRILHDQVNVYLTQQDDVLPSKTQVLHRLDYCKSMVDVVSEN